MMNKTIVAQIIIGADETGVGDYLTPLVVAAVFIPPVNYDFFAKLGVTDSKKLNDRKMRQIYEQIKLKIKSSVRTLEQKQYNKLNRVYNAHELKMLLHLEAINSLSSRLEKVDQIIIDQFASPVNLQKYIQKILHKNRHLSNFKVPPQYVINGEIHHLSVAAASIVARVHLLKLMDQQNQRWNMIFPLGTNKKVEKVAQEFVNKYGFDSLEKVAKLSFKTTKKILPKPS